METTGKQWLFRPFEFISEFKALSIGLAAILLSGIVNYFSKAHFDGVLDVHFGNAGGSISLFITEGLVDWLVFTVLLFASGLIFSTSSIRFIDVAGTQAMARWPMLIAALAAVLIPHESVRQYMLSQVLQIEHAGASIQVNATDFILFGLLTLIILACSIWMLVLMFRAFSIACNLKGSKAIWIFVVTLIVAEALSKYLLTILSSRL
jgi:hypothetical protein